MGRFSGPWLGPDGRRRACRTAVRHFLHPVVMDQAEEGLGLTATRIASR